MNIDCLKDLNYFLKKPITIITRSINRNFNETQSIDYFTGICEKINLNGIFTRHPITNCINFIFFSSIIGIFEEQQLDPENPDHKLLIKEIEEKKESKTSDEKINIKNNNNELDIDSLNKLLKK